MMLMCAVDLSIPLIVISSLCGTLDKKIKDEVRLRGEIFDKIIGIAMIGIYFLCLSFQ